MKRTITTLLALLWGFFPVGARQFTLSSQSICEGEKQEVSASLSGNTESRLVLGEDVSEAFTLYENRVERDFKDWQKSVLRDDNAASNVHSISFDTNKPLDSEITILVSTKEGEVQIEGVEGMLPPNKVTTLKLKGNKVTIKGKITMLGVKDGTGGITSVDLTNAPLLIALLLGGNEELNSIDVSQNKKLQKLYLAHNKALTALDVTGLNELEILEVQQTGLSPQAMSRLIATLPAVPASRSAYIIVQEKGVDNSVEVYTEDVQKAKEKNWDLFVVDENGASERYGGIEKPVPTPELSFTTTKEVGSVIAFTVEGVGEVTAEGLTPSTIVVDSDEPTEYTLTAQTVVLKGEIKGLEIVESELTELDVTKMPSLESIDVSDNTIEKFDFSNNNALKKIAVEWCYASEISLPQEGEHIEDLYLQGNDFTTIALTPYTELNYCDLSCNSFKSVDVSANESLEYLYLDFNHLKAIDVSKNIKLLELAVGYNSISTLDLSTLESLVYLDCKFNKLTVLDISHNPLLKYLFASGNTSISKVDITPCPKLRKVELMGLALTDLDLSATDQIRTLNIGNTKVPSVTLSNLELLEEFSAAYTSIESFDFSHNAKLQYINVASTKITSLELPPQCPNLTDLVLYSNALDPKEMSRIIEHLPPVPLQDDEGNDIEGWLVLQHKGENANLLEEKGFNPINVYKNDVAKAKEKNWKLKIFVPGVGYGPATFEDYSEGIDTSTRRIAARNWHVVVNGKIVTLVGARQGANYRIYSCQGELLHQGIIRSSMEKIELDNLASNTYLVVIEGNPHTFIL